MQQLDIWSIVPQSDASNVLPFHAPNPKPDLKRAATLRKIGVSLQKRIDFCKSDRSTHTRKKAQEAEQWYFEGVQLQVVQSWCYQMADAIEASCLPSVLGKITTRTQLETLRKYCKEKWTPRKVEEWDIYSDEQIGRIFNDPNYGDEYKPLLKAGIHSVTQVRAAIAALWDLPHLLKEAGKPVEVVTPVANKSEAELRSLQIKLSSMSIRGFFPTQNPKLLEEIFFHAELEPDMLVLEPHGGQGDLIEAIFDNCDVEVETGEYDWTLHRILQLKGYEPMYHDFLEAQGLEDKYDRVIANPPWGAEFEPGIELKHIVKMYECAKPGSGRIVTLIPSAVVTNTSQQYVDFREWLDVLEADIIDLPKGCFARNKVSRTGADAKLLVIDKPEVFPVTQLVNRLSENFPHCAKEHKSMARQLFKLSRAIFKTAVIGYNDRELTLQEEELVESYKKQAKAIAQRLGTKIDILSDIRGYIIKLFLPNGRYNCWAGEGWWGI